MNPIITFFLGFILAPFWLWGWLLGETKPKKKEWVIGVIICSIAMIPWIFFLWVVVEIFL